MPEVETDRSKEQGKRDSQGNDDGAANVAQKKEEDNHDQDHAFCQVVQDGVSGVVHEIVAVQIRHDLHTRGQDVIIQLVHHGVQAFQHGRSVCAFAQKNDAFYHIVVILNHAVAAVVRSSNLTQANPGPLRNHRDISYPQGSSVLSFDHRLFDVTDISNQAYAAYVDLL